MNIKMKQKKNRGPKVNWFMKKAIQQTKIQYSIFNIQCSMAVGT
jgi:hypothetical protein